MAPALRSQAKSVINRRTRSQTTAAAASAPATPGVVRAATRAGSRRGRQSTRTAAVTSARAVPAPDHEDLDSVAPVGKRYTDRKAFTSRDRTQTGRLISTFRVERNPEHECCRRFDVDLTLRLRGVRENIEAGLVTVRIVDKAKLSRRGKQEWIRELLEHTGGHISELRQMFQLLYYKKGTPRRNPALRPFQQALTARKILFIEGLQLEDEFRNTGLVNVVLRSVHEIAAAELGAETATLSPARIRGSNWRHRTNGRRLNNIEVEALLIRMYTRNGYQVYIQGDPAVRGSTTMMGQGLLWRWM